MINIPGSTKSVFSISLLLLGLHGLPAAHAAQRLTPLPPIQAQAQTPADSAAKDQPKGETHITPEQAKQFREQGAIGSHLENLERNEGFKGFNQTGVSEIIAATDPRKN